ncbi:Maf family protein [Saezia sanguinis]|uniref:Maf family protein n=1 Tax=Saezia sanguinis TaxID=1965230 RepID=UPI001EF71183|nr:Maf family protein [Saezia sanguinis]
MTTSTSLATFDFIYLASQSPRRRELLGQIGVRYEMLLPDAQEDAESLEAIEPQEAPAVYVQRVTRAKLQAAVLRHKRHGLPAAPVLCADTTVALGATIYGKPENEADACRILSELQNGMHQVLTAVAVALPGQEGKVWQRLSTSHVRLAAMSAQEIERYVLSGESMGKAGAYAIQGRMAAFVSHIEGSYSGIMGLPLYETAQLLSAAGVKHS